MATLLLSTLLLIPLDNSPFMATLLLNNHTVMVGSNNLTGTQRQSRLKVENTKVTQLLLMRLLKRQRHQKPKLKGLLLTTRLLSRVTRNLHTVRVIINLNHLTTHHQFMEFHRPVKLRPRLLSPTQLLPPIRLRNVLLRLILLPKPKVKGKEPTINRPLTELLLLRLLKLITGLLSQFPVMELLL